MSCLTLSIIFIVGEGWWSASTGGVGGSAVLWRSRLFGVFDELTTFQSTHCIPASLINKHHEDTRAFANTYSYSQHCLLDLFYEGTTVKRMYESMYV